MSKRQREDSDNLQEDKKEYGIIKEYRDLENDQSTKKVQITRTGDIKIAIEDLNKIENLFSRAKNSKNNSIFAYDAKALVNISEMAQISIKNWKMDVTGGMVNVNNIINGSKKYMLKDYFNANGIQEVVEDDSRSRNNEDDNNEMNITNNNNPIQSNTLQKTVLRSSYLDQFNKYDNFFQFNWYKLGGLYNELSRGVDSSDHLMGPLSLEQKKIRVNAGPRKRDAAVGAAITAEKVTKETLNVKQEKTTPEYVQRSYKILKKKMGFESISLFKFIIDPESFSKSIENLFYTSFLIKENRLVLEEDEDGMPTIRIKEEILSNTQERAIEIQNRNKAPQNHIIFQMDMPTWRKLIEKYDIKSSFLRSSKKSHKNLST
ncbi:hypothetical protein TBLA_0B07230 [Henningerozyma blattae CBS 6284]|uniref:Non-structural maintenance of chromosomes element 4 n=1 Tax=Henningerozyma blattae (strain ATCC 34711 / CBS 6284 / DSM 70876 / NBRC 10599 / NRRL Y-10934 / UCD 77-7) TaxID=1071380 RepID=I2GZI9_HENB6|nr:hypothetical protein TBLA_0B07230 [Tetrapisispora blattae CBS 6284]CCH59541.1 hypothetical protein TBLA_0B07230 [Tetrapisispora blattae CBS 6284]